MMRGIPQEYSCFSPFWKLTGFCSLNSYSAIVSFNKAGAVTYHAGRGAPSDGGKYSHQSNTILVTW